jgi:hypothetical protein
VVEVPTARLDLLAHPAESEADPQPAGAQLVQCGQSLGEDDWMVVGQYEDVGGQAEPGGQRGQVGEQVQRIGQRAVVGQRRAAGRRVGVPAGGIPDHHGVFDDREVIEPEALGVLGEVAYPGGVGGLAEHGGEQHAVFHQRSGR